MDRRAYNHQYHLAHRDEHNRKMRENYRLNKDKWKRRSRATGRRQLRETFFNRRARAIAYLWADRRWTYARIGEFFGKMEYHHFVHRALMRARRQGILIKRTPFVRRFVIVGGASDV